MSVPWAESDTSTHLAGGGWRGVFGLHLIAGLKVEKRKDKCLVPPAGQQMSLWRKMKSVYTEGSTLPLTLQHSAGVKEASKHIIMYSSGLCRLKKVLAVSYNLFRLLKKIIDDFKYLVNTLQKSHLT